MDDHEFAQFARNVFESMGSFLAVDSDGNVAYASRSWASYMGLDPEEILGKPLTDSVSNTMLDDLLSRAKESDFTPPENYFIPRSGDPKSDNIRRRLVVYRDGVNGSKNVEGVAAFSILYASHGQASQNETLDALSALLLRNTTYSDPLSDTHTANREPDEILGSSSTTHTMKSLISKVAPSSVSVCILGETGTGKELVANAIHKLSKRADKPFVKINCAAIPKDLIESELFGYEAGAFTGALRSGKIGKFELASGGTLLLDEIAEMSLDLQAKLLRVLQSQELERVGGTKSIPIDVRLICSTNRDLKEMVKRGEFRADLYYRINTMEIKVPPLRERRGDLSSLISNFIQQANKRNGLSVTGVSDRASALLRSYDWPGNVRELENTIERACVLCGAGILDIPHLGTLFSGVPTHHDSSAPQIPFPFSTHAVPPRLSFAERERQMLLFALDDCGGNRAAAARQLGISRSTLYAKLKKHGID